MLTEQKSRLAGLLAQAAAELVARAGIDFPVPEVVLDRPKLASHGDLACNLALQLARPLKASPRAIAEALAARVRELDAADSSAVSRSGLPPGLSAPGASTPGPRASVAGPGASAAGPMIQAIEIAGPGFINITIRDAARRAAVARVLADGAAFGRSTRGAGRKVIVEFVSANPTGPLHVGHGRQGALGDALAGLLEADGWQVMREFYYNDAGAQIDNLARSVQARARSILPADAAFPIDGYRGDYIREIADDYLAGARVPAEAVGRDEPGWEAHEVPASGDPDDLDAIRRFAVAFLRREQDLDLRSFGVRFDNHYLESSLYEDGRVQRTVEALVAAGRTFAEGGALWLRSTDYGDDKDRVMRKSDGSFTYFVPDVAYHLTKWERGFEQAINIQGSDHHGTIARVRAGLQALDLGIPAGYPDYVLHKMVTVMRGGEEVKISKRAGSYVTLRDLITWSGERRGEHGEPLESDELRGRDAVRFFLISRKADTEFVFDVDLALARSDENPVYYIQYAHARLCSVLAQWGGNAEALASDVVAGRIDLAPLDSAREWALIARLTEFPERVADAVDALAPHLVAFYLKDLAAEVHSYYNAERFLVDDEAVRLARLALVIAARQVLHNGLTLIGVSAPERM